MSEEIELNQWRCQYCTFDNESTSLTCYICSNEKKDNSSKNTFIIYTIGIGDWCNINVTANTWNTIFRNNIFRNIDNSFDNIIIRHYDPLMYSRNVPVEDDIVNRFIDDFKIIIDGDIAMSNNDRTVSSEFIRQAFPTETVINDQHPHIVIDLAHLFRYFPNNDGQKRIRVAGHYGEEDRSIYTNINCIYVGYVGTFYVEESFCHQFLCHSNIFKTSRSGGVTTLIDRIYTLGYNTDVSIDNQIRFRFDDTTPTEIVRYIFSSVRRIAMTNLRSKGVSVDLIDKIYTTDFSIYIVRNIVDEIMDETQFLSLDELIEYIYNIHLKQTVDLINN